MQLIQGCLEFQWFPSSTVAAGKNGIGGSLGREDEYHAPKIKLNPSCTELPRRRTKQR